MRAMETGRYLVRATNTGVSGIINDRGGVEAVGGVFRREVITGMVQPMQGMTPYASHGDWPAFCLSFTILAAYLLRRIYLYRG
jgi:apolipoprotein N-acyltransferase